MKRLSGLKVAVLFVLLILTGSCAKKEPLKINDIQFANIQLDTISHLFNDTTKPGCEFKLNMQYPSSAGDSEMLKKLQSLFIMDYFNEKFSEMSPAEAAHAYMKEYVSNYMQLENDYTTLSDQVSEGMSFVSFNYQETSESDVSFNAGGFISYTVNYYNFTGGAHGMQSCKNYVIDLHTMFQLTLTDLFADVNLQPVSNLIIREIAKEKGYEDPTQLNEDGFFSIEEVVPTDNFRIDEKGITWTYNPYEIAVYALGIINVSVEWEELKPYLREDSPVADIADASARK